MRKKPCNHPPHFQIIRPERPKFAYRNTVQRHICRACEAARKHKA